MASPDREVLARLMAQMADGDAAALFPFLEHFGGHLAGMVRRTLTELHRSDVARSSDDVDYLVQSAALVLFDRAAGWDHEGALPWTWAGRAIRAEIVRWLGHPAVEWDTDRHGSEAETMPTSLAELEELADEVEEIALLLTALDGLVSPRDRDVHLQYQVQKGLGDQSPAHTIANMHNLSPANVRQIDRRVRVKLAQLVSSDARWAALRALSWVEAC